MEGKKQKNPPTKNQRALSAGIAGLIMGAVGGAIIGASFGSVLPGALLGAIVYAVNHAFIKSALLMITGIVASPTSRHTARLLFIGGVGQNWKFTSVLYLIGGLSLAGAPPFNGFISKLSLVQGGIDAQGWTALALVVSAGLLTFLYMVRTWQHIFQRSPDQKYSDHTHGPGDSQLAPALLIGLCVLLGIYARPLIALAQMTVQQIGDPSIYIMAVLG